MTEGPVPWADLCRSSELKGRWVALEGVRYEAGVLVEGHVVDADVDLAALCARVQSGDRPSCAIVFCDDNASGIRRTGAAS